MRPVARAPACSSVSDNRTGWVLVLLCVICFCYAACHQSSWLLGAKLGATPAPSGFRGFDAPAPPVEYDVSKSPFASIRSLSAKATGDALEPLLSTPLSFTHSRRWAEQGAAGAAEEARPWVKEVVQTLPGGWTTNHVCVHSAMIPVKLRLAAHTRRAAWHTGRARD